VLSLLAGLRRLGATGLTDQWTAAIGGASPSLLAPHPSEDGVMSGLALPSGTSQELLGCGPNGLAGAAHRCTCPRSRRARIACCAVNTLVTTSSSTAASWSNRTIALA